VTDAADELYALAPGDFTSERDALAKRLRGDGRRDEAMAVKALRKPTTPVWALNQVARRKGRDVEALLRAGGKLRDAHEALLRGGDRKRLRSASEKERELVTRLVREAVAIADAEGVSTTAAFQERVGATLRAAASDEQVAAELRAGRLAREHEAVGLFGEVGASDAEPKRRPKPETKPDPELERTLTDARKEEQRAQRALDKAGKATQAAEKRAADAKQRADEARGKAQEAAAALRAAKADESEAAKLQRRAARAVTAAEKKSR
jgi:hypothetical protein